jgi:RNA polymerase-binding transcription factor DksA|tara:strand:- start:2670 stop:3002 length:333 start_codon:yes stop_codon:yes gene_type:complete
MKKCKACGEEIHPKRLEILPSALTCVSCSTTGKKAGVSVVLGEGDHTYNEIVIMEPEEFEQYKELELKINGKRKDDISHPEEEEEEEDEDGNELEGIEEVKNIDSKDLED